MDAPVRAVEDAREGALILVACNDEVFTGLFFLFLRSKAVCPFELMLRQKRASAKRTRYIFFMVSVRRY